MQLSPEDQKRVFGKEKLKTAYQRKKRSLSLKRRVKRVHFTRMSDENDDLNRDSPNGYPTVTPTELQPVTLAH